MEFAIQNTWDSNPVDHDPIRISFSDGKSGLRMEVSGPFFNDPESPAGEPGIPFPGLWDYEVVESFFLDSTKENYLEVELCPHGQHLVLLLSGVGNAFYVGQKSISPIFFPEILYASWVTSYSNCLLLQQQLPIDFTTTKLGDRWTGEAVIPWTYFPPNVDKMNSYAIHGSGAARTYEALYPIPKADIVEGQQPNFHRLEYFQNFRLQSIMGEDWVQPESDLWKEKA
uniref:Chromosome 4 open reading frame 33 n=1 Tax=Poecilia reticulata TaxID=8081 RepID=A0A3P9MV96_POERE